MRHARPRRREPIFNLPAVVSLLLAVLTLIHLARLLLTPERDDLVLGLFAFAPGRYLGEPPGYAPWPGGLAAEIWSPFTYALLHNDALHLVSNGVVLAALGNVLARRTTTLRFLLFVVVMAPISALGELLIAPWQSAPVIGLSGVICAMMGGFARVMFPPEIAPSDRASAVTMASEEEGLEDGALEDRGLEAVSRSHEGVERRPVASPARRFAPPVAGPVVETLRRPRVLQFIAAFAILNGLLVFGAPVLMGSDAAGVAWMVHVAGFVAGFLLWPLFDLIR